MNLILSDPSLQWIGLTLIHFLWQGALIAGVLAVGLRFPTRTTARWRHNASVVALLLLLLAPVLTWIGLQGSVDPLDELQPGGGRLESGLEIRSLGISQSVTPSVGSRDGLGLVVGVWSLGVALFGIRLVGGWWRVMRWVRRGTIPANRASQQHLDTLARRIGIRRPIKLVEASRVSGPWVFGWIWPVIVIPMGMLTSLPAVQIEALLLHELAHVRYHDFLINLLQRMAETLLFYHPAVWWVSEQIRRERELRCDDLVVATIGESRPLAEALLALAERNEGIPVLALGAQGGALACRIRRLLGGVPAGAPGLRRRTIWALMGVGLVVTGFWLAPILTAPKLYQSRVMFAEAPNPQNPADVGSTSRLDQEITILRSAGLLDQMATSLGLGERRKIQDPGQLIAILRSRSRIERVRGHRTLMVVAADADPKMAADMANQIAMTFIDLHRRRVEARDDAHRNESGHQIDRLDGLLKNAIDRLAEFSSVHGPMITDRGLMERQKVLMDDVDKLREIRQKKRQELILQQVERQPVQNWAIIDQAVPASQPKRWYP